MTRILLALLLALAACPATAAEPPRGTWLLLSVSFG